MDKLMAKKLLTKRIIIYLAGVLVMSVGIAMSIKADVGVAPGSVLPYATSKLTPLSVGLCTTIFHIFFMLVQLAITRKPTIIILFQLPLAWAFGFLLDVNLGFLSMSIQGLGYNILLLVAGMVVFSAGIRAIVGANLILMPPDALARTIGDKFGWTMSKSKLIFDIVVTLLAAVLTYFIAGNALLVVGIGTVICAIGTGPGIFLFTKLMPFLD